MTQQEKLKNIISKMPDKRLSMFVVCCHVDKLLEEKMAESVYNIPIQAGAHFTDKRVCEINDMDDCETNISDRNQRYSEMTAMYWIGQNIQTEYVGINHYRRRFLLDDKELAKYLDEGFDIITTIRYPLPEVVNENYRKSYYGYDWSVLLDILREKAPEYLDIAATEFEKDTIHPCNMNIMKSSVYKEYCDFAFPILDECYKKTCVKMDTYQRRDTGFVGERLSSLFVEKKRREGLKVIDAPFTDLRSKGWCPEDECDLTDYDAVFKACEKYYKENNITRCRNLVAGAIKRGGLSDERMLDLAMLFHAAVAEQRTLKETLYEYLPSPWKIDLATLLSTYSGLKKLLLSLNENPADELLQIYQDFKNATGFSSIAIKDICEGLKIDPLGFDSPILVLPSNDICYGSLNDMSNSLGLAFKELGGKVIIANELSSESISKTIIENNNKFKCIIGVQNQSLNSDIFSSMKNVPKVNIIMDSPYFLPGFFDNRDDKYFALFQDFKYADFVKKYTDFKNAMYMPAAGRHSLKFDPDNENKKYDVVFLGSYNAPDYSIISEDETGKLFVDYMIKNYHLTYEEGIRSFFDSIGITYQMEEIPDFIWENRQLCYQISFIYRTIIIETILSSGIKLNVFGDTWNNYNGKGKENLIINPATDAEEGIRILEQSRISLNIMSWHKAGITERITNTMFSGSVCISDSTLALENEFIYDDDDLKQEIVLFDLGSLESLPSKIKNLLADKETRERIANNAARKIANNYTWKNHAEQILDLIEK